MYSIPNKIISQQLTCDEGYNLTSQIIDSKEVTGIAWQSKKN